MGATFTSHRELYDNKLHRAYGKGIAGNRHTGVDSIVASGGYADDEDHGDVIVYTAEGGHPDKEGHIHSDQSLSVTTNAGLVVNVREGLPLRVIEGTAVRGGGKKKQYTYRGLFRVEDYWSKKSRYGCILWQFRLVQTAAEPETLATGAESVDAESSAVGVTDVGGLTELEKQAARFVTTQRRVRSTQHTRAVKELYGGLCQLCRIPVTLGDGVHYSEGAHVQALGRPHLGPDVPENILCLCPNCHVLFDNGARLVSDELRVVDALSGQVIGDLYVHARHNLEVRYLRQHRARWIDRSRALGLDPNP